MIQRITEALRFGQCIPQPELPLHVQGDVGGHAVPHNLAVRLPAWVGAQLQPPPLPVGAEYAEVDPEVGKALGAGRLRCPECRHLLRRNLPVQHAGVAQDVFRPHAVQSLHSGTQIEKARRAFRPMGVEEHIAVRKVVPQRTQPLLVLAQLGLVSLSCRHL